MEVDTAGTTTANGEQSVMAPAGSGGAAGAQVSVFRHRLRHNLPYFDVCPLPLQKKNV